MLTIADYKAAWNSQAILAPAERAKEQVLKKFGLYCRTVAKNSMIDVQVGTDKKAIRKRDRKINKAGFIVSGGKKVSAPDSPAFSRVGYVKKFIYSAADENEVVIGPALLLGVRSKGAVKTLEHGGTEQLTVTNWVKGTKTQVKVTASYKARPTMGLAFEKTKKKQLPKLLEHCIIKAV